MMSLFLTYEPQQQPFPGYYAEGDIEMYDKSTIVNTVNQQPQRRIVFPILIFIFGFLFPPIWILGALFVNKQVKLLPSDAR